MKRTKEEQRYVNLSFVGHLDSLFVTGEQDILAKLKKIQHRLSQIDREKLILDQEQRSLRIEREKLKKELEKENENETKKPR